MKIIKLYPETISKFYNSGWTKRSIAIPSNVATMLGLNVFESRELAILKRITSFPVSFPPIYLNRGKLAEKLFEEEFSGNGEISTQSVVNFGCLKNGKADLVAKDQNCVYEIKAIDDAKKTLQAGAVLSHKVQVEIYRRGLNLKHAKIVYCNVDMWNEKLIETKTFDLDPQEVKMYVDKIEDGTLEKTINNIIDRNEYVIDENNNEQYALMLYIIAKNLGEISD